MARAAVVFIDDDNDVKIELENGASDNPTPAQESARILYDRLRKEIEGHDAPEVQKC